MTYNDPEIQRQFDDWKNLAGQADILSEAQARGAKLRRAGAEWMGPCLACGGTDRFSIHPGKRIFNCRGAKGGDVIGMVMHLDGVDFLTACEQLTGEPPPRGKGKALSAEEVAERDRRRQASVQKAEAQRAEAEMDEAEKLAAAKKIWTSTVPIAGTVAERYLIGRGIPAPPMGWPDMLRFHRSLRHPVGLSFPALVCRVDDLAGSGCAVWRVFLNPETANKADVENAKLGLGPAGGGAVRIGGVGPKIGVAEGVETALAAWTLEHYRFPIWSALSTSGMTGLEVPLAVERVCIYPDGDFSKEMPDGTIPLPPGIRAAQKLHERLCGLSIKAAINHPPRHADFLDVLNARRLKEMAA